MTEDQMLRVERAKKHTVSATLHREQEGTKKANQMFENKRLKHKTE